MNGLFKRLHVQSIASAGKSLDLIIVRGVKILKIGCVINPATQGIEGE